MSTIIEEVNRIIQAYAHDFRDMKMSQVELQDMLSDFLEAVEKSKP